MARRGRGEGGITKRRDGRWMGQADLGWQDGKRRRKSLYGRTKSEVQAKLRETLHRKAHGMPPVPEQETVGTFLRRWLDIKKEGVRQRTWARYEQIVRAHLLPNLDRIRLAQLTPQDVAECLRRVKVSGSAYMARGARDVLRTALNQALRWELVSRNVAVLTDPPRHRTREITPLTPGQAGTLLAAVAGHRLEALITVALGLGLRQGEALGLRWEEDVDLEAGKLSVQQTLVRAGREPRFEEPKTDRSRRTITMPGVVAAALRRHRTRQLEEQLAAGPEWHQIEAGLHDADRDAGGQGPAPQDLQVDPAPRWAARHPVPRSPSHGRDAAAGPRGGPADHHGDAGPLPDQPDYGPLRAHDAHVAGARRGADGCDPRAEGGRLTAHVTAYGTDVMGCGRSPAESRTAKTPVKRGVLNAGGSRRNTVNQNTALHVSGAACVRSWRPRPRVSPTRTQFAARTLAPVCSVSSMNVSSSQGR